jgi:arylsulfatase A-like enzyme
VKGPPTTLPVSSGSGASRPNIVFVLTDDLTWNLLRYMPHVLAMEQNGLTFPRYFVTDSLCCPSRTSIFTGQFPHDTGVFTNSGKDGGFNAFISHGDQSKTFAAVLRSRGYQTGLFGKFLNLYDPSTATAGQQPYIPPGWSAWDVADAGGYREYNYHLAVGRQVGAYGSSPSDYLTSVLSTKASQFIAASSEAHRPFFAEVSTFAPHSPFVPAPPDVKKFRQLPLPETPAFGRPVRNPPTWLANVPPLTSSDRAKLTRDFRLRVRDVQSVDRMVAHLETELRSLGEARNTYFVFSSDNGLHLGEHNLREGKQTAFDTDTNVPLIVTGPGVPHGTATSALVQNIDLAPTFETIAGATPPSTVDGHALNKLLHAAAPRSWRTAVLIEHHGPVTYQTDPDYQGPASGHPPTYEAMRTDQYLYVEYQDGDHEFYNLATDPYELDNRYAQLSPVNKAILHATLTRMRTCHGSLACWDAQHPPPLAIGSTG